MRLAEKSPRAARSSYVVGLGFVLAISGTVGPTRAEPPPSSHRAVDAHYQAGKKALEEDRADEALEHFKEALRQTDDEGDAWQMLLAIAVTYREMGQPAFALEYYRRFLQRTDEHRDTLSNKWRKRRALAETDIDALEARTNTTHGFVTVRSTPTGAAIFIDGAPAGADRDARTEFGMFLPAGEYTIAVRLDPHAEVIRQITVRAGKIVPLTFTLAATEGDPDTSSPPGAIDPSAGVDPHHGTVPSLTAASTDGAVAYGPWTTLGVGAAMTVAGGILAALAAEEHAAWTDYSDTVIRGPDLTNNGELTEASRRLEEHRTTTHSLQVATGVVGGLGLAALTAGLVWMMVEAPESDETFSAAPRLELAPSPTGVMGRATWEF